MSKVLEEIKELKELIFASQKQVFNAREAAIYLRIGYDTILRLTRAKQIEHVKNGANYIYKKEYLDSWLDKNKERVM